MTDIPIRDVPDEVLAAIDAKAQRVGLSRNEYLRGALERESTALAIGAQATGHRLVRSQLDRDRRAYRGSHGLRHLSGRSRCSH
jgi:hypothetical protein